MKLQHSVLLVVTLFACASCALPFIGGGIAGAGFDSVWTLNAAKNYAGHQSPLVQLTREHITSPNVEQTFNHMLDGFPEHTLIQQDSVGRLGDLTITFRRQHLLVSRAGAPLIDEHLPSAFYMHQLQIGRGRLSGRDVLLFITRSRAATGLCFVGFYHSSGERLWTTTLPSFWDCRYSPQRITFLTPTDRLHIGLRK